MHSTTSTTASDEGIWLSPAILRFDLGAAEKLLLAYLCQKASQTGGTTTASNPEIANTLGMKTKTVSEVINRLGETNWLAVSIDKMKANQRSISPLADLLLPYPVFQDSPMGLFRVGK